MNTQQIRVIVNGESVMVDSQIQAQRIADDNHLDLIEVAPNVYKVMDYKKHLYEQQKRAKQTPKQDTKEAQFALGIAQNDLQRKIKDICKWLQHGDNVRVVVKLKGREQNRPELGMSLMTTVVNAVLEQQSLAETPNIKMPNPDGGRNITTLLKPAK